MKVSLVNTKEVEELKSVKTPVVDDLASDNAAEIGKTAHEDLQTKGEDEDDRASDEVGERIKGLSF